MEELAGQGLRACVQPVGAAQPAMWVRLGSHAYAGAPGVVQAVQAVYLAQEAQSPLLTPLAVFELSEGLRAEAAAVVAAMQRSGLHVQLLSGDGPQAVARIAQEVGIGDFVAECSPQSKLAHIRAMQEDGRHIAMVGDGLNDGPVLAGANVSFAFGRAVPLAQARSDFVVLSDNLELVWQAVLLARKTLRIVRQNLLGSALYNALSIPLAMVGWMPAWLAGLGMALSSLLVVLNAARLAKPVSLQPAAPQVSPVSPSMPATA